MALPKLYAFDVDHTLEIQSGPYPPGPVKFADLSILKRAGNIIGVAGNWTVFTSLVPHWWDLVSFIGPMQSATNYTQAKGTFLKQIKYFVRASEYIMVGNDPRKFKVGVSDDIAAANLAGYRFINEIDFSNGKR